MIGTARRQDCHRGPAGRFIAAWCQNAERKEHLRRRARLPGRILDRASLGVTTTTGVVGADDLGVVPAVEQNSIENWDIGRPAHHHDEPGGDNPANQRP